MLRRLASLTCVLSLLLAPSLAIGSGDGPQGHGLVGTWLLTIDFEGIPQFRMLLTVNADGTSNGPLPDLGPGYQDTRSACIGPWKRTGLRTYQLNMYCLDSQEMNGVFNRGSFDITLSKNGRSFSDPSFKFEWWLGHPSDGVYLGFGHGSVIAERLYNVAKD